MVEACVSLALLGLTWALLFHFSHLSSAATRSAVAARHAAWSAANGVAVSSDSLGDEIFFDTMAVSLTQSTGRSTTGGMLGGGNPAFAVILAMFPQIRKADVSATPAAGTRAHNLTNVRFPIVHTGPELTYVSAHCEWDSVNQNWDDLGDILSDMFP
jgi:hypothetical protein